MEGIGPLGKAEILFRAGLKGTLSFDELDEQAKKRSVRFAAVFHCAVHNFSTPAYVALDSSGQLLAVATFDPTHLHSAELRKYPSLNEALSFASTLSAAPRTSMHQNTVRRVKTELEKALRKLGLLTKELADSQNAAEYRQYADLLMGSLHLMTPGQHKIEVPDLYSESADETAVSLVEIPLDPALGPMANVQRYYKNNPGQQRLRS